MYKLVGEDNNHFMVRISIQCFLLLIPIDKINLYDSPIKNPSRKLCSINTKNCLGNSFIGF
jgi:hypothetical protein